MKPILSILCWGICWRIVLVVADEDDSTSSPLQQVITLLEGMLATSKTEKRNEQGEFSAYNQWCKDFDIEKGRDIAEATEKLEKLQSDIKQNQADIDRLTNELSKHDQDISVWNADKQAAQKVRTLGHADYVTLHNDYSGSVSALAAAIAHLRLQIPMPPAPYDKITVTSSQAFPCDLDSTLDIDGVFWLLGNKINGKYAWHRKAEGDKKTMYLRWSLLEKHWIFDDDFVSDERSVAYRASTVWSLDPGSGVFSDWRVGKMCHAEAGFDNTTFSGYYGSTTLKGEKIKWPLPPPEYNKVGMNTNACPSGWKPIMDVHSCIAALGNQGIHYHGDYANYFHRRRTEHPGRMEWRDYPTGCLYTDNHRGFYNAEGTTTEAHHGVICYRAKLKITTDIPIPCGSKDIEGEFELQSERIAGKYAFQRADGMYLRWSSKGWAFDEDTDDSSTVAYRTDAHIVTQGTGQLTPGNKTFTDFRLGNECPSDQGQFFAWTEVWRMKQPLTTSLVQESDSDESEEGDMSEVFNVANLKEIPQEAKAGIDLFLAQTRTNMSSGGPYDRGYTFGSWGILERMQELHDKFVDKKNEVELKENNQVRALSALNQDLNTQIQNTGTMKNLKSDIKGEKEAAVAADQGTVSSMTTSLNADKTSKQDTEATCAMKASEFHSRDKLRAEEIASIEEAIKLVTGDSVSGAAAKHSVYLSTGTALAQLRARSPASNQARVQKFLQSKATQLHSKVLAAVVEHLGTQQQSNSTTHPLVPVKKMIKDLLMKLMESATEEAGHKQFCDTEMAANTATRNEKSEAVEQLQADMDTLTASISQLDQDIGDLATQIADLDKSNADATVLREKEKAENEETISDAEQAQMALAKALTTLRSFYSKAEQATALVQDGQAQQADQAPPAIFNSPFQGATQSSKSSVITLLESIEADFAQLETSTREAEANAVSAHDGVITNNNDDKQAKFELREQKKQDKWKDESRLINVKRDMEDTQKELDAALKYYEKLRPTCVDASTAFDDRIAARSSEIDSLQLAFRMLNGEDINP